MHGLAQQQAAPPSCCLASHRLGSHTNTSTSGSGCSSSRSALPWAVQPARAHGRRQRQQRVLAAAAPGDGDAAPASSSGLEATIKRKFEKVGAMLNELGLEATDERLQAALESPVRPPFRLGQMIQDNLQSGKPVLIVEIGRTTPEMTSSELAELAKTYEVALKGKAAALAVSTDEYVTPDGLRDLWMVAQAVPRMPVLRRDWILHPIQVAEAKEAGAVGIIGCITQVLQKGAPMLSGYSAAIGMDAPMEVVNLQEVEAMAQVGVPCFCVNVSVGLSLSVPGIASSVAKGVIGQLPFGCYSIAGVRSVDEAREARYAGADALLVKREAIAAWMADPRVPGEARSLRGMVEELEYVTSGDD